MSNTPFRFPASDQERKTVIQKISIEDEEVDFIVADMSLGMACQDICRSRDELTAFALRKDLAPYLEPFLKRRGWLDDDWRERLEALSASFQHQVN